MIIEIKNHKIVEPKNKAEADVIYPVKDGFYKEENDPIDCTSCGITVPEIGIFPENWKWGAEGDLCPDCADWKGAKK